MRLVCQQCGTRFRIADRLVRGRIVRFRCKKCSSVLEARLAASETSPDEEEKLLSGLQAEVPAPRRSEPPPLPERAWYVAADGQQSGPMSLAELRLHIRRGRAGADDLCWRKGLGMWQPIVAVDEVNTALNEPRVGNEGPPPLPDGYSGAPGSQSGLRVLRVVAGGGNAGPETAWAAQVPVALPDAQPDEVGSFQASGVTAAPTPARWPLWVAILGGMMMVGATATLFLRRDRVAAPATDELAIAVGQRTRSEPPAENVQIDPVTGEPARSRDPGGRPGFEGTVDFPPIEGQRERRETTPVRPATPMPLPFGLAPDRLAQGDQRWSSEQAMAAKLGTKPEDVKTALAVRVFRRNQSTLVACDQLAERRAQPPPAGSRAEFVVQVSATGAATVAVQGWHLPEDILSCYRAVAAHWEFPVTGTPYTTTFEHVH